MIARLSLIVALTVSACGDPPDEVLSGEPGPIAVEMDTRVAAIVQPVDGAPPVIGQAIAEATARALGPRANAASMLAADDVFLLRGRVVLPPLSDPDLLTIDWSVSDRRNAAIGGFIAVVALPDGSDRQIWARIGPSEIGQIGAESARLTFDLAPIQAALDAVR